MIGCYVRRGLRVVCALTAAFALAPSAFAELTIRITQGVEGALPIAILPFAAGAPGALEAQDISEIIRADLERSGRFAPLKEHQLPERPIDASQTRFPLWRATGAHSLVLGQIAQSQTGGFQVQFQLLDVFQGTELTNLRFTVRPDELRRLAHHISDVIYERLTGERGAFSTRIAYVTNIRTDQGERFSLMVADADGFDPQTILSSPEPIMSPAWSPDGQKLAYVSFEGRRSKIFVQEVYTGVREMITSYPGINGAPAWSPDGTRLALTLSRDGNPEIYIVSLAGKQLTRLTNNAAIDTEPVWSPDGRSLFFTSDRGGGPQIYRLPASGGSAARLTFEGSYNGRPTVSADGKRVAMVHRTQGQFRVAVQDLASGRLSVLTDGRLDESPSFAPNGQMILYAASDRGNGVLAAVSVDGRVKQRLQLSSGDVREPAWSPYIQ